MVERTITLTVTATINQPLQKPFPYRFVNGQQPSDNPLTVQSVPHRFRLHKLTGSFKSVSNLLGADTRYGLGVV